LISGAEGEIVTKYGGAKLSDKKCAKKSKIKKMGKGCLIHREMSVSKKRAPYPDHQVKGEKKEKARGHVIYCNASIILFEMPP